MSKITKFFWRSFSYRGPAPVWSSPSAGWNPLLRTAPAPCGAVRRDLFYAFGCVAKRGGLAKERQTLRRKHLPFVGFLLPFVGKRWFFEAFCVSLLGRSKNKCHAP